MYDRDPEKRRKNRERMASPEGRERRRLTEAARRARIRGSEATLTRDEWLGIVDRFNGLCAYCLSPNDLTIEHIKPLSKGGNHSAENVIPACRRCNHMKNAKDLIQAAHQLATVS